jgi:phosphoribosylanthranilate isomerase
MIKVKICGITDAADGRAAVEAGADALGFVFAPSPRRVTPRTAREIIALMPPFVAAVGVFVNEVRERVTEIAASCGLDYIQLHGNEPPSLCNEWGRRAIKAVRVRDEASLAGLSNYHVAAYLLDSYVRGKSGGTGETFSWDIAVKAKSLGKPIILSGGLTKDNVVDAIKAVGPYAIDVSSGVESAPGKKDHSLVTEFIRRAKGVALQDRLPRESRR